MYDKWVNNARRLGLPLKNIGVPWAQIIDIENFLKNKYNNKEQIEKYLDDNIIRLQNTYCKMEEQKRQEQEQEQKRQEQKRQDQEQEQKQKQKRQEQEQEQEQKRQEQKRQEQQQKRQNQEQEQEQKRQEQKQEQKHQDQEQEQEQKRQEQKQNKKILNINKQYYKYTPHIEEDKKRINDKIKINIKKKNKIRKKKINKKEKKIEETDEDLNKILEEMQELDKINKRRRDNKLEEQENKKNTKNIKKIKNKIETLNRGEMDVIQNDKDNKNNNIKKYYYHLKEQIISIDYDNHDNEFDNNGFKMTLIRNILNEKEKIENIRKISKCNELFFDTKNNYFKILVVHNDKEQYKQIITATMLISNMVLKIREKIESAKIHFSLGKVALMF